LTIENTLSYGFVSYIEYYAKMHITLFFQLPCVPKWNMCLQFAPL